MIETLRAARVNNGLKQSEAAKLFDVSTDTLARWEKDNTEMPINKVNLIPKIYGIDTDHIFFGNEYEFIRRKDIERNKRFSTA